MGSVFKNLKPISGYVIIDLEVEAALDARISGVSKTNTVDIHVDLDYKKVSYERK